MNDAPPEEPRVTEPIETPVQRTGPTGWAPPKHTLLTTVIVLVGALAGVLSVLAAIFDGGLASAQRDEAAALRDQAAFNYRSTVLAALNEVEDSLIALQRLEEQAEHVEAQRNALAEAFRHATNRYRAGYSPHLDQLDAQRDLLSAELSLVQIQADGLTASVDLLSRDGRRLAGPESITLPGTCWPAYRLNGSPPDGAAMINHVSLGTNDVERARRFYDPLFALIGFRLLKSDSAGAHYGTSEIIFSLVVPTNKQLATAGNGTHIAFQARSRQMVDDFHAIALKNGGRSDGAPGIRPEYDDHYYGTFVFDPDGNKIEAVSYSAR